MKSQHLLLASLAVIASGPALAQSSVSVWGRLNVSAERQKLAPGVTATELVDNSSRLGFKGVEDLGGGLKAGFALEHGFDATTGQASTRFWGRGSEVFLSSGLGMLRLGNFTSEAYYATADYVSMHNHDTGTSADVLYAYMPRNINKVSYRTPDFGGFTAEVAASEADASGKRGIDGAANFTKGPLALGAGYQKLGDANQFALRALYTLGNFTFGGYAQRDEDGFGAGLGTRNNFRLVGMYAMGSSEFHLNYGRAGKYSNVPDSKAQQATIAYGYNLSKRTRVYTFYTKVDADPGAPYVSDFSSFALGVRHNF